MRTVMRRIAMLTGGLAVTAAAMLAMPAAASAQVTMDSSLGCGYDGYVGNWNQQPSYTHCGKGRVEIRVDHLFWLYTYFCAVPGTQDIPQGNVGWRILGAEYDGKYC